MATGATIVVVTTRRHAGTAAQRLAFCAAQTTRAVTDSLEARQTAGARIAAATAIGVVAAGINALATTVGLPRGTDAALDLAFAPFLGHANATRTPATRAGGVA
jgi:hypothetical protein